MSTSLGHALLYYRGHRDKLAINEKQLLLKMVKSNAIALLPTMPDYAKELDFIVNDISTQNY